ncbi:MAG: leucyl/phenylalanyl-tRNA--protein transferase [Pirellulaceae bacterium]
MQTRPLKYPTFPAVETADADGLLMLGGELSPVWILEAYRQGIFPWPLSLEGVDLLAWFSPHPRAIFELDQLHISRRLRRRLRNGGYKVTTNRAFDRVMASCAAPREDEAGTWITPELATAYRRLHELGYAHSVEVWHREELVGGLYGVSIGGFFSGESMYHRHRDASKIAICHLVRHLDEQGFTLFDIQQSSLHCSMMGAIELGRDEYLQRLRTATGQDVSFGEMNHSESGTFFREESLTG